MKRASSLFLLAILGCGARSPLAIVPARTFVDAFSGMADVSTARCQIQIIGRPTRVFVNTIMNGTVDSPVIARRPAGFDFAARGRDAPAVRQLRAVVTIANGALSVTEAPVSRRSVLPSAIAADAGLNRLYRCFMTDRVLDQTSVIDFARVIGTGAEEIIGTSDLVPPNAYGCNALSAVGSELFAFVTVQEGGGGRPVLLHSQLGLAAFSLDRFELAPRAFSGVNATTDFVADVGQSPSVVAWVSADLSARQYNIRTRRVGAMTALVDTVAAENGDTIRALPGIASRGNGSSIALAFPGSGRVVVRAADGSKTRSEPIGFDMGAESSPAIVAFGAGWLVGMLAYGDEDPSSGSLVIQAINAQGALEGRAIEVSILRVGTNKTQLAAATDGSTAMFHWDGVDPGTRENSTFALAITCR